MENPDEITANNLQPLPSQARRMTKKAGIFRKYLKEVKDLSDLIENKDGLGEALGYLTNIRKHFQGTAPKESDISYEPSKVGSRRKFFSAFTFH